MPPRAIYSRAHGGQGRDGRGRRHRVVRLVDIGQPHRNPTPSLPLKGMDKYDLPKGKESVDDIDS